MSVSVVVCLFVTVCVSVCLCLCLGMLVFCYASVRLFGPSPSYFVSSWLWVFVCLRVSVCFCLEEGRQGKAEEEDIGEGLI